MEGPLSARRPSSTLVVWMRNEVELGTVLAPDPGRGGETATARASRRRGDDDPQSTFIVLFSKFALEPGPRFVRAG
jgi:hypothetical protein